MAAFAPIALAAWAIAVAEVPGRIDPGQLSLAFGFRVPTCRPSSQEPIYEPTRERPCLNVPPTRLSPQRRQRDVR